MRIYIRPRGGCGKLRPGVPNVIRPEDLSGNGEFAIFHPGKRSQLVEDVPDAGKEGSWKNRQLSSTAKPPSRGGPSGKDLLISCDDFEICRTCLI